MKKVLVGFTICLLLLSCSKKETQQKNSIYVISHEDKKFQEYSDSLKESHSKIIVMSKKGFYGESQLIIDKKDNLYYYQKEHFVRICGNGDANDTLPHFLNLKPKDIVKIPQKDLSDFLYDNILTREKNRQILIIASQNDTIKNSNVLDFISKSRLSAYVIRRTTQEEDTVLKYKKSNNFYYSDEVKWDYKKITFPFIKPKLYHPN